MIEVLEALIKVIDLTLKKNSHKNEIAKDKIAYDLIALLIELEKVENQAKKVREQLSFIDRKIADFEQTDKDITYLNNEINQQLKFISDVNKRIHQFSTLFSIYMEENELPIELKAALTLKKNYLLKINLQLSAEVRREMYDYCHTSNYNSEDAMSKLAKFKSNLSLLIKEHVSIEDFVKWYT